jgi:hypothetical protein
MALWRNFFIPAVFAVKLVVLLTQHHYIGSLALLVDAGPDFSGSRKQGGGHPPA